MIHPAADPWEGLAGGRSTGRGSCRSARSATMATVHQDDDLTTSDATVLRVPDGDVAVTWALLTVGGAAAGVAVGLLRDWALSLAWVPFRALLVTLDAIADAWGVWGLVALAAAGAGIGALVAADWQAKQPRIQVSRPEVVVAHQKKVRRYRRDDVREALHEDGALVLLAANGTDLARVPTEVAADDLAAAFRSHGYVWTETSPTAGT